ncbi:MAG: GDSL-type esterase/lipase family protein [Flavonifractor plautii]
MGDSNTHGYCADPADCADGSLRRFNESERWTCRLQAALGEDFLVLEEGLPGRTTVFDDPVEESLSALPYLYPCLMSHAPVSLLVVMLGTNDTKERLGANACAIGKGLRRLVRKAQSIDCWAGGQPNLLIVAPPAIGKGVERSPVAQEMGLAAWKIPAPARPVPAVAETRCHFLTPMPLAWRTTPLTSCTSPGRATPGWPPRWPSGFPHCSEPTGPANCRRACDKKEAPSWPQAFLIRKTTSGV